jgi:membrane protease YdiL (CAAX protease family)
LNGLGGLAFGWLYWKRGLESAIMAHFSADIVLHVITPLVVMLVV